MPDRDETMPTSDDRQNHPDGVGGTGRAHDRFEPGTVLAGRYRIISFLGRGGMGAVYRADDLTLDQPVALKFLPVEVAHDEARLALLRKEVRIGREIAHPNVCRVYDIVESGLDRFLTMEYVEGEDLGSLLRRIGRLPPEKAVEIARQICSGLGAAHDKGVLHRDLKPANIMLDERGRVRLTDFGIAAVAESADAATRAGTPAYMAPEQLDGKPASVRSDVYALGLVLYELFTGSRPHRGESIAELRDARTTTSVDSLTTSIGDIDPVVERVILRCLEPDPGNRPVSAVAVAAALPGGDPLGAALAAGETPSPELVARSNRIGGLHPALALLVLAVFGGALFLHSWLQLSHSVTKFVPLDKPPAAMIDRAKETIERLGIETEFVDSAWGYEYSSVFPRWIAAHDDSPDRWERLREARPPAVYFWYRATPSRWPARPSGFQRDRVTASAPPWAISGEVYVSLDLGGRLRRVYVQPPTNREINADDEPPIPFDFATVFELAGLDPEDFALSEPRFTLGQHTDVSRGWVGEFAESPGDTMYVDAGSLDGSLAYFRYFGPWDFKQGRADVAERLEEKAMARVDGRFDRIESAMTSFGRAARGPVEIVSMIVMLGLMLAGGVLTYKNFKSGRVDTRGAWRVALFTGVCMTLAKWISGARLTFREPFELWEILAWGAFMGLAAWSAYLAIEPVVRRRWPTMLVGWTRLISGRFTDPLVGRCLLVGCAAGTLISLGYRAGYIFGNRDSEFLELSYTFGHWALRYAVGGIFAAMTAPLFSAFIWVLILVGLRRLVGRDLLALVLFLPVLALLNENLFTNVWSPVVTFAAAGIYTLLYVRLGVLAVIAALFAGTLLGWTGAPDLDAWYAIDWYIFVVPLLLVVLWGFGATVFGRNSYETALS